MADSTFLKSQISRASQLDAVIAWVEVYHKTIFGVSKTYRWAERPSARGTDYIEARVLSYGYCARSISDRDGRLEGDSFTVQLADTDNLLRGILGSRKSRAVKGVEVVVKMQRVEDMDAGNTPTVVFRGRIDTYSADNKTVTINCVGAASGLISRNVSMPTVGAANGSSPFASRSRYGSILYGLLSDASATGESPLPASEVFSKATEPRAIVDIGDARTGFAEAGVGYLQSPPFSGTTVILVNESGAGLGTFVAGDVVYFRVTSIFGGVEHDPGNSSSPFQEFNDYTAFAHTVVGSSTRELILQFQGNGADSYNVYVGRPSTLNPTGVEWTMMLNTTGEPNGDGTFDIHGIGAYVQTAPWVDITGSWGQIYYYTVVALFSDGETAVVNRWRGSEFSNMRRPHRLIWWTSDGDVLGYYVYRQPVTNGSMALPEDPGTVTVGLAGVAGLVTIGSHEYYVQFGDGQWFTQCGSPASITVAGAGNAKVNVTGIPLGPSDCLFRKIFRTAAGQTGVANAKLLTIIADNTTTTYLDNIADGSLGASAPADPVFGPYDRRWTVPTTNINDDGHIFFEDSLLDDDPSMVYVSGTVSSQGVVPCVPFGPVVDETGATLFGMAVAGHAIKSIDLLYTNTGGVSTPVSGGSYGSMIFSPGQTGYSGRFTNSYYDAPNGTRWTLFYIDPSNIDGAALISDIVSGTTSMRANVQGIEDVGDSSGELIVSGVAQTKHFLMNFGLPSTPWAGGLWLTMPLWADGTAKINSESMDFVEDGLAAAGIDSTTAWGLFSPPAILDVLADRMVDNEMAYFANREGQMHFILEYPLEFVDGLTYDALHTEVLDIGNQTFGWVDNTDPSWFYNYENFVFRAVYDDGGGVSYADGAAYEDLDSQAEYVDGIIRNPSSVTFAGRKVQGPILLIEKRRLARATPPPREAHYTAGLMDRGDGSGIIELGDLVAVTTQDGPGNWAKHFTRVQKISSSFETMQFDMTLRDINHKTFVEDEMAEFPLGGSLVQSPDLDGSDPITLDAYDPPGAPCRVAWDILADDVVVEALGQAQVESGVTSIQIIIWNETDSVQVGTSAVITANALTEWVVSIPNPGDGIPRDYSMKASVIGAAAGKTVQFKGKIRVTS